MELKKRRETDEKYKRASDTNDHFPTEDAAYMSSPSASFADSTIFEHMSKSQQTWWKKALIADYPSLKTIWEQRGSHLSKGSFRPLQQWAEQLQSSQVPNV